MENSLYKALNTEAQNDPKIAQKKLLYRSYKYKIKKIKY